MASSHFYYVNPPSRKTPKERGTSTEHSEWQLVTRATKAIAKYLQKAWRNQRELRILVTGKTGQGKSTLINGILGAKVAEEGAGAARCTTNVEMYAKTIEGVPINVFDSPGLQDRTVNEDEYIQRMREQCKELSLVLYCTKMTNTRLTDDDKNAMMKLTKAFGNHFWDYAVFVLTFANREDVDRSDSRDENEGPEPHFDDVIDWQKLREKRFEGRLKLWTAELKHFLIEEVHVDPMIAKDIPVVPTGDHKKTPTNRNPLHLPDRDNWFYNFWEVCCVRVKETRLFLKVNSSRMVSDEDEDDTTVDDDQDEEQGNDDRSKNFLEEVLKQLSDWLAKKAEEAKSESHSVTSAITSPTAAQSKVERSESTGTADDDDNDNDLIDMHIHIHRTLIMQVVNQTIKRAGFDDAVANVAKKAVEYMQKPVTWFKKLFTKK